MFGKATITLGIGPHSSSDTERSFDVSKQLGQLQPNSLPVPPSLTYIFVQPMTLF